MDSLRLAFILLLSSHWAVAQTGSSFYYYYSPNQPMLLNSQTHGSNPQSYHSSNQNPFTLNIASLPENPTLSPAASNFPTGIPFIPQRREHEQSQASAASLLEKITFTNGPAVAAAPPPPPLQQQHYAYQSQPIQHSQLPSKTIPFPFFFDYFAQQFPFFQNSPTFQQQPTATPTPTPVTSSSSSSSTATTTATEYYQNLNKESPREDFTPPPSRVITTPTRATPEETGDFYKYNRRHQIPLNSLEDEKDYPSNSKAVPLTFSVNQYFTAKTMRGPVSYTFTIGNNLTSGHIATVQVSVGSDKLASTFPTAPPTNEVEKGNVTELPQTVEGISENTPPIAATATPSTPSAPEPTAPLIIGENVGPSSFKRFKVTSKLISRTPVKRVVVVRKKILLRGNKKAGDKDEISLDKEPIYNRNEIVPEGLELPQKEELPPKGETPSILTASTEIPKGLTLTSTSTTTENSVETIQPSTDRGLGSSPPSKEDLNLTRVVGEELPPTSTAAPSISPPEITYHGEGSTTAMMMRQYTTEIMENTTTPPPPPQTVVPARVTNFDYEYVYYDELADNFSTTVMRAPTESVTEPTVVATTGVAPSNEAVTTMGPLEFEDDGIEPLSTTGATEVTEENASTEHPIETSTNYQHGYSQDVSITDSQENEKIRQFQRQTLENALKNIRSRLQNTSTTEKPEENLDASKKFSRRPITQIHFPTNSPSQFEPNLEELEESKTNIAQKIKTFRSQLRNVGNKDTHPATNKPRRVTRPSYSFSTGLNPLSESGSNFGEKPDTTESVVSESVFSPENTANPIPSIHPSLNESLPNNETRQTTPTSGSLIITEIPPTSATPTNFMEQRLNETQVIKEKNELHSSTSATASTSGNLDPEGSVVSNSAIENSTESPTTETEAEATTMLITNIMNEIQPLVETPSGRAKTKERKVKVLLKRKLGAPKGSASVVVRQIVLSRR